jgi:hypothetical protein
MEARPEANRIRFALWIIGVCFAFPPAWVGFAEIHPPLGGKSSPCDYASVRMRLGSTPPSPDDQ